VAADPNKVKVMASWPTPKNITALRAFLGLTGFYRRFVKNYATVAGPLTDLLRANSFVWNETAANAFQNLKDAMTQLPLLTLPNFDQPFEVTTDASIIAIGAVLSQNSHPIAFFSRKLTPRLAASSTYVRELYAITEAIKKMATIPLGIHLQNLHRSPKPQKPYDPNNPNPGTTKMVNKTFRLQL
jgi:hypothetical protein